MIEDIQGPDFWSSWTTWSICEGVRCAPVQLYNSKEKNCAAVESAIVQGLIVQKCNCVSANGKCATLLVTNTMQLCKEGFCKEQFCQGENVQGKIVQGWIM